MTDLQAALGVDQLPRLDDWIDRRAELWTVYDALLADFPVRTPLRPQPQTRHLYQLRVEPNAGLSRDELLDGLTSRGIGAGVRYRGVQLQPYRRTYGLHPGRYPIATDISKRTLSLSLSPDLTERDQLDVVDAIRDALARRILRARRSEAAALRT